MSAYRKVRGQALVLTLAIALIGAAAIFLLYNTGQSMAAKGKVTNAADAAAYSGGVWVARHLNFMAYTNRAMVANHIAVGHFVSYMSWLRYVEDTTENAHSVLFWVPYVGAALNYAKQVVSYAVDATEEFGTFYVPGSDIVNNVYHLAQLEAQAKLLLVTSVMNDVAKSYDSRIELNSPHAIGQALSVGAIGALSPVQEHMALAGFTARYDTSGDEGRIKRLVETSYGPSRQWVQGNRGWDFEVPVTAKFQKKGSTTHRMGSSQGNDFADWEASDRLQYSTWSWNPKNLGWSGWKTMSKGSATAREFDDEYEGLPGYYALSKTEPSDYHIDITAITSLPISATNPLRRSESGGQNELIVTTNPNAHIIAGAKARVYHRRTDAFLSLGNKKEYSNLFNPFWQVRLVDSL